MPLLGSSFHEHRLDKRAILYTDRADIAYKIVNYSHALIRLLSKEVCVCVRGLLGWMFRNP